MSRNKVKIHNKKPSSGRLKKLLLELIVGPFGTIQEMGGPSGPARAATPVQLHSFSSLLPQEITSLLSSYFRSLGAFSIQKTKKGKKKEKKKNGTS